MRVAFYLRRSTDENLQADSIAAQHALLTTFAHDHGHVIVDDTSFHDNASGRTARRPGFQRLIAVVQAGAPFDAVLVRDVSRWGRFQNVDEAAFWEFYLKTHGVEVVYVEEQFRDADPYAAIQKMLRRFVAAEFSRDKARLVQFGMYRATLAGYRRGGTPPFGMVRILIAVDGTPLAALKPGEWKFVSAQRIKLAAGDPDHVAIVRHIYQLFVRRRLPIAQITKRIGRTYPGVLIWTHETIRRILRNPAYAGIASGCFNRSENFSERQTVLAPDAWAPVVDPSTWRAAQRRLEMERSRRSPEGLTSDLCAFARTVNGPAIDEVAAREYFSHVDAERYLLDHAAESTAARAALANAFRERFDVVEVGEVLVLNGLLRVGVKLAYPSKVRAKGGVTWRFSFDARDNFDVAVGIALAPVETVVCYFHICKKPVRFASGDDELPWKPRTMNSRRSRPRSLAGIVDVIRLFSYFRCPRARRQFYEMIKDLRLVNASSVARQLGWSTGQGVAMYGRLKRRGYVLPPLRKQNGRWVEIICHDCGKTRRMLLSQAVRYPDEPLCRGCRNARKHTSVTCPDCGKTRTLRASVAARLSHGSMTRCEECNRAAIIREATDRRRGRIAVVKVTCPDCGASRTRRRAEAMKLSNAERTRCMACTYAARRVIRVPRYRVVCPDCGAVRIRRRSDIARSKDGEKTRCRSCAAKAIAGAIVCDTVTCPDCGAQRVVPRYFVKRMSNGTNTRCKRCSSRAAARHMVSLRASRQSEKAS